MEKNCIGTLKHIYPILNNYEREINLFVRYGNKDYLWRYLYEEVRPNLSTFAPEDRDTIIAYLRKISGIKNINHGEMIIRV